MSPDPITQFEQEFEDEKSFNKISFKIIKIFYLGKKGNLFFYLLALFVCSLGTIVLVRSNNTLTIVEKITALLMQVEGGLLGFLIAGFAIYAAISNLDLLYLLTSYKDPKTGLSQFHVNYLSFFEPFVILGVSFLFTVVGYFLVLLWPDIQTYPPFDSVCFCYIIGVLLDVYFFVLYLSVISLKDFTFNVYQIAILMGRFLVLHKNSGDMDINEIASRLREQNNSES